MGIREFAGMLNLCYPEYPEYVEINSKI